MNNLGRPIMRYRLLRDMSLRDLGDAAAVHYSCISKLERGTTSNPSRDVMRRIAIALDAPVDEFEMAAGYMPQERPAANRRSVSDTALPADVQYAIDLILDELRNKHRNGKH